ncbi:MAG: energy transducer TonB [Gemmatimonadales bacterium]
MRRLALTTALLLSSGCAKEPDQTVTLPLDPPPASTARGLESPVPLNPDAPTEYPPALAQQRIGGTVILRLFLDEAGAVVPESTRIHESSGYPALDSAALAAVPGLRYAPALRDGRPAASAFLQPFNFRPPPGSGATP